MRIVAAVAFLALALPAHAEDARYALSPSRDGFVRLDTVTGAASHCASVKGVWRCEPLQIESNRLDALATEVAALKAKVAALAANIAALPEKQEAPAALASEPPRRPSLLTTALGRFLAFVRILKHGRDA
jgi:hypothetical protein